MTHSIKILLMFAFTGLFIPPSNGNILSESCSEEFCDIEEIDVCEALMPTIIHVKEGALLGRDGSSWDSAYAYLQDALHDPIVSSSTSSNPVEIWIAEGTYYADQDERGNVMNNDRDASFEINSNIKIYGGFEGDELSLSERDWVNHSTILDGDIDNNQDTSNNTYQIIRSTFGSGITLDGIEIQGGNANEPGVLGKNIGAGIWTFFSSFTILNCTLIDNHAFFGGAIHSEDGDLIISNCSFTENSASFRGGAIDYRTTNPGEFSISNSIFE